MLLLIERSLHAVTSRSIFRASEFQRNLRIEKVRTIAVMGKMIAVSSGLQLLIFYNCYVILTLVVITAIDFMATASSSFITKYQLEISNLCKYCCFLTKYHI